MWARVATFNCTENPLTCLCGSVFHPQCTWRFPCHDDREYRTLPEAIHQNNIMSARFFSTWLSLILVSIDKRYLNPSSLHIADKAFQPNRGTWSHLKHFHRTTITYLDKIVVKNSQNSKLLVCRVIVLCKTAHAKNTIIKQHKIGKWLDYSKQRLKL